MCRSKQHPRGVTSLLAMLYLVLFSSLVVGFYSMANTTVQLAANDEKAAKAFFAAESGMQFVRYQLANLDIPHNTQQNQLFATIYTQLKSAIENTHNMGSQVLGYDGSTITIPSGASQYITLDDNSARFRAVIAQAGQQVQVTVTGWVGNSTITRSVRMNYGIAQRASAIFNFGVASRGKIVTGGSSMILGDTDPAKGSVLSTCMTDSTPVIVGGKEVSGDISVTNPSATVTTTGAKVGGTSDQTVIQRDHVHKGVEEPEFPTVDTDAFKAFAVNKYVSGNDVQNVYIPPNTNPKFTGGATVKGVMYIQTPNVVEFKGNCNIQGVIVVQNSPTGDLTSNKLIFGGTVDSLPVDQLPASFGDLRKLTGSFILAPNFAVSFSGDFKTVNGSIIASQISMTGNAGGTVKGSVINLNNTQMSVNGSSEIIIASTGTTNYPSGVFFGSNFVPLPDTYNEVP